MNDENLRPFNTLTEREQREIRSKGGKASVAARRKAKSFKEIGEALSKATMREGNAIDLGEIKEIAELKGANLTVKELMIWQQVQKALSGDTKAFEVVRDTMGEKPNEKIEITETNAESVRKMREYLYGEDTQSS